MAQGNVFRLLRQGFLLYILIMVAWTAWLARERSTSWENTLRVAVYPINGDQSQVATDYISSLESSDFEPLEKFFAREINRYGLALEDPIKVYLRDPVQELPPSPPQQQSPLRVIHWSLKMRYWAWNTERKQNGVRPDIKMFVIYFDPERTPQLAHSLGLQKGLLGVVNAYAGRNFRGNNQVILAHEMMHTVGASDKYDPSTTLPLLPDGLADPDANPVYPQRKAEIMAGRIAISPTTAEIPSSLKRVLVGPKTAAEISWAAK